MSHKMVNCFINLRHYALMNYSKQIFFTMNIDVKVTKAAKCK